MPLMHTLGQIRGGMRRPGWRRDGRVLACLLAVLLLLFGYAEQPLAEALVSEMTVAAAGDADGAAHDQGGDHSVDHGGCMHHGHCSFQALMPEAPGVAALVAIARAFADDQFGRDRFVVPWRRPPKPVVTL